MGEMRQVPVNLSHENLLAVLDDIRARVAEGDSFEGHIEWMIPMDDDAPARSFDVQASYRVGNLMGQGGMRMIGEWCEVPAAPACRTCDGSGTLEVPDADGESASEQACPDPVHDLAETVLREADRWELYPARGDDHRALADEYARDIRGVLTRLLARWQRDAVPHPEDTDEHRAERNQLDACARSLASVLLADNPRLEG